MKRCLGCMQTYDNELNICPHCGYVEGTEQEEAIHMVPGAVLNDRYIIGRVVGYGGFGVTYIAWDKILQHRVAIKEYLPSEFSTRIPGQLELTVFNGDKSQQFEDGLKKFIEEARRLAKFQNEAGIVKVFDCFENNKTAYIIMEYLEGITLSEYIKENGRIPVDVAVQMLMPIMNSLKTVHKAGIIHRDIAPDNIMITVNGEIKLIDFGAARYATTSHSRSLTVIIKPGYSPEEQYRSRGDQGPHTDVYAIGAVLYRMVTGMVPPDAMERRAFFENSNKDILEPLRKYDKNLPQNRENAILNAMNIRIEDRSPDMDTLIQELTSNETVARLSGKIKKVDILKWPVWLKITVPTALVAIITLTVLFLTGVIGFNLHSPREIWIPDGMTRVPRVVSMNEDEASTILSEKQLDYVIVGLRYDEQIGAGCVLTQSSSVGSVVPINSALEIIISAGVEQMETPYVTGFELAHAIEEIEANGFLYEIVEEYDSVIEEGCIVSQSIAGGVEGDKGSMITLVVSKGRNPETEYTFSGDSMPDFTGKSLDNIKKICETYGIKLIVTEYEYSDSVDEMCVISQEISPNTYIQSDVVLKIVLSKSECEYKVPSLVYLTEEEAAEKLDSINLPYTIKYEESENVAKGCVVSQSIEAGKVVDATDVIELVVSSGPPSFDMINVIGMQENEAIESLQSMGLIVTSEYVYDENAKEGEVVNQSTPSGDKVYKSFEITLTVCSNRVLVQVPDVVGKNYEEAKSILEKAGFVVEKNEVYNTNVRANGVVAHSPQGGSSQKEGAKILLTVSLGKEPVNVTFDANGGTVSDNKKVVYYTDVYGTLPTPTRNNYKFLGWYTQKSSGTKVTADSIVSTNSDVVLYARWERVLVKVTFDANGGTASETSKYIGLGENYTLPTATRDYYTFAGWYTEKTGGTKVTSQTQLSNSNAHVLYAHWTVKKVEVTYNAGQGKVTGQNKQTYELGSYYKNVEATRTGYAFVGWYTQENGKGERVLTSTVVTNEKAHTLYAYWSNSSYTVSFDSCGGNQCDIVNVVYDQQYGTLPTPTRKYYTFDGWYTSASGGTKVDATTKVSKNSNHTLYAHWTRKTVSVAYVGGADSTGYTNPIKYNLGDTYLPNIPTKTGYTFVEWCKNSDGSGAVSSSTIVENEKAHTLYAKWQAAQYKVNFNPNGSGAVVSTGSKMVAYNSVYGTLPTPTRAGYNFDGWYTQQNGGDKITENSYLLYASESTLWAHWTEIYVSSVVITPSATVIGVGESCNVQCTVSPSNALNKDIVWSSSNTNVATVSNGTVTGKAAGTAVITAQNVRSGKTSSFTITVKNVMYGYDLSKGYVTFGDSFLAPYINGFSEPSVDLHIEFRTKDVVGNGILFASLQGSNSYFYIMIENGRLKVYSYEDGTTHENVIELAYDLKPDTTYRFAIAPVNTLSTTGANTSYWLKENGNIIIESSGYVNKFMSQSGGGASYIGRCPTEPNYGRNENAANIYLLEVAGDFVKSGTSNFRGIGASFNGSSFVNTGTGVAELTNPNAITKIYY